MKVSFQKGDRGFFAEVSQRVGKRVVRYVLDRSEYYQPMEGCEYEIVVRREIVSPVPHRPNTCFVILPSPKEDEAVWEQIKKKAEEFLQLKTEMKRQLSAATERFNILPKRVVSLFGLSPSHHLPREIDRAEPSGILTVTERVQKWQEEVSIASSHEKYFENIERFFDEIGIRLENLRLNLAAEIDAIIEQQVSLQKDINVLNTPKDFEYKGEVVQIQFKESWDCFIYTKRVYGEYSAWKPESEDGFRPARQGKETGWHYENGRISKELVEGYDELYYLIKKQKELAKIRVEIDLRRTLLGREVVKQTAEEILPPELVALGERHY